MHAVPAPRALSDRAQIYAALGEPVRLAIADDLITSDRSPGELGARHLLPTNLVAHHLTVLEQAGLVERLVSSGDGRRRYVRLSPEARPYVQVGPQLPRGPVLFVCTHNSARSQLAAALWADRVGQRAASAGTRPAVRVHPGAVRAAAIAGLDLTGARPRRLAEIGGAEAMFVVTVCDRVHEELAPGPGWWHWSIPDPVDDPRPDAFDRALAALKGRIDTLARGADHE